MTTAAQIRKLTERFREARSIDDRLDIAAKIRKATASFTPEKPQESGQPETLERNIFTGAPTGHVSEGRSFTATEQSFSRWTGGWEGLGLGYPTLASQLLALSELHRNKELSDEEFQRAKDTLLGERRERPTTFIPRE